MDAESKETLGDKVAMSIIFIASVPAPMGAALVVALQTVFWIQNAVWVPLSVLDGLKWVAGRPENGLWLWYPRELLGLHLLLEKLPLSGGLLLLGIALFFFSFSQADPVGTMVNNLVKKLTRKPPKNEENQD